jgi:hypothetical protein
VMIQKKLILMMQTCKVIKMILNHLKMKFRQKRIKKI